MWLKNKPNSVSPGYYPGFLAYFDAIGLETPPNDAEHPTTTHEQLKVYDPALYEFVDGTMAYNGEVDWRNY